MHEYTIIVFLFQYKMRIEYNESVFLIVICKYIFAF